MRLDSTRPLQLVSALAEHRNFHRAAKALGMTQPSLTRALKVLEAQLGVRLFDRDGPVRPTVFGRILLERSPALIHGFDELAREIALARGLDVGELRLSVGPYPAVISAHRALGRIAAAHPGVAVDLKATDWIVTTEHVLEGRCDLGFTELAAAAVHPDLETERVRDSRLHLVCRAGHPLAGRRSLSIEDVTPFPSVGSSYSRRLVDAVPELLGSAAMDDRGRIQPRFRVDTVAGMLDIVAASDAICGILPSMIRPQLDQGLFHLLPLDLPGLRLNYGFIWRRGRTHSPIAATFMALVREIERSVPDEVSGSGS